jgi:hypothetical protein
MSETRQAKRSCAAELVAAGASPRQSQAADCGVSKSFLTREIRRAIAVRAFSGKVDFRLSAENATNQGIESASQRIFDST